MNRPLVILLITYAAGILLGMLWRPSVTLLITAGFICLIVGCLLHVRGSMAGSGFVLAAFLVVGGIRSLTTAPAPDCGGLFGEPGRPMTLEGIITGGPERLSWGVRFYLRPDAEQGLLPGRGLLQIVAPGHHDGGGRQGLEKLVPGERVRVSGRLERPAGARNPGALDYRRYLARRGVHYQLVLGSGDRVERLEPAPPGAMAAAGAARRKLSAAIERVLTPTKAAFLRGVLFGDRGRLPPEILDDFRGSGLVHILAVSGLHVGFIGGAALFLGRRLGLRGWATSCSTIAVLAFYAMMADLRPSVVRAAVMAAAAIIAHTGRWDKDSLNVLALAGLVLLLPSPGLLADAGFQLSFAATAGLLVLRPGLEARLRFLPRLLRLPASVSLAAQLAVAPISLYHFDRLSLVALVANLAIVPVVGVVVVLGMSLGGVGLLSLAVARYLAVPEGWLIGLVLKATSWFAAWPIATISPGRPGVAAIVSYYLWLLLVLVPLHPRSSRSGPARASGGGLFRHRNLKRVLAALLITVSVIQAWSPALKASGRLRVFFLDVGQGDAAFLLFPSNKTMIVDTGGPAENGTGDLVSFLLRHRIRRIDYLALTHSHLDHVGQAAELIRQFRVGAVIGTDELQGSPDGREILALARGRGIPFYRVKTGDELRPDGAVAVRFLHPGKDLMAGTRSDANNNSVVFQLVFHRVTILFTGDLEAEGEEEVLRLGAGLSSTVLKVGHHGSAFSTTPSFLQEVRPRAAVIQVGKNPYGLPQEEIIDRLEQAGAPVFRTDRDGAVILSTDGGRVTVETMFSNPEITPCLSG